jgi:hypothetical protein
MKTATSAMADTALADNVMKERIVFLSLVSPFKEVTLVVCASLQQQIDYRPLGPFRPGAAVSGSLPFVASIHPREDRERPRARAKHTRYRLKNL